MQSPRKDNIQLPSLDETFRLREMEAQRPVDQEKAQQHFVDFGAIKGLADALKLDASLFDEVIAKGQIDQGSYKKAEKLLDDIVEKLAGSGLNEALIGHLNDVYDYLSEEDEFDHADIGLVFGGKSDARPLKAAEVYAEGKVDKLLCSGRGPVYGDASEKSEAEKYKDVLIKNGVQEEDIITENLSITIPDNVRSSLNLLDEKGINFKSIALVTSPFSQRRSYVCVMKYVLPDVKVFRLNSDASEKFSRDGWYKSEDGIRVIINEYIKMAYAITHNDA